jgi:hypothetical protein
MASLHQNFSKNIIIFKKYMDVVGINVIEEKLKMTIQLVIFYCVMILVNISSFYSFYINWRDSKFVELLKVVFVYGIVTEVK